MGDSLYEKVVAILLANGCYFKRQGKGSHEMWYSPISKRVVSVPVTMKARPTANAILKQAGISERV